jgi:hypothetical protein
MNPMRQRWLLWPICHCACCEARAHVQAAVSFLSGSNSKPPAQRARRACNVPPLVALEPAETITLPSLTDLTQAFIMARLTTHRGALLSPDPPARRIQPLRYAIVAFWVSTSPGASWNSAPN